MTVGLTPENKIQKVYLSISQISIVTATANSCNGQYLRNEQPKFCVKSKIEPTFDFNLFLVTLSHARQEHTAKVSRSSG